MGARRDGGVEQAWGVRAGLPGLGPLGGTFSGVASAGRRAEAVQALALR